MEDGGSQQKLTTLSTILYYYCTTNLRKLFNSDEVDARERPQHRALFPYKPSPGNYILNDVMGTAFVTSNRKSFESVNPLGLPRSPSFERKWSAGEELP